jgi:hypothetical protein
MEIFEADSLDELISSNDEGVWFCIVSAIFTGLELDLDYVSCFQIQNQDNIITFNMEKKEWGQFLDNAIEVYSLKEEYEMCQIIKEYKEYL